MLSSEMNVKSLSYIHPTIFSNEPVKYLLTLRMNIAYEHQSVLVCVCVYIYIYIYIYICMFIYADILQLYKDVFQSVKKNIFISDRAISAVHSGKILKLRSLKKKKV